MPGFRICMVVYTAEIDVCLCERLIERREIREDKVVEANKNKKKKERNYFPESRRVLKNSVRWKPKKKMKKRSQEISFLSSFNFLWMGWIMV